MFSYLSFTRFLEWVYSYVIYNWVFYYQHKLGMNVLKRQLGAVRDKPYGLQLKALHVYKY